jgi:hypothetical protein
LSALCKAVTPEQVQVTYSAHEPLPFRVEWNGEYGPVSFAGPSPDHAAERALSALRARRVLPYSGTGTAKPLARVSCTEPAEFSSRADPRASTAAADPSSLIAFAEAMDERIERMAERPLVGRPNLRLVRS